MPRNIANKVIDLNPEIKYQGRYELIEDVTKFSLPGVEYGSGEIFGAGLLGTINIPDLYNPAPMEFSITSRALKEKYATSLSIEGAEFRISFVVDNISTVGSEAAFDVYTAVIKGRATMVPTSEITKGNPMELTTTYAVWYYKLTRNGSTIIEIDVVNQVLIINGEDLTARLKASLANA